MAVELQVAPITARQWQPPSAGPMTGWLGFGDAPTSARLLAGEPFVWGGGGRRMSPEQIEFQRQLAAQQQRVDYSPVGHWLQGAARLAENIGGALRERRVNKAAEANAVADALISTELMKGASPSRIAAILADPQAGERPRELAKMQFEVMNRKPSQPHYWETNNGSLGRINPTTGLPEIVYNDPTPKIEYQWIKDPNTGQMTGVPITRGGAPTPTGPQIGAVVDGYRFKGGDPNKQESWEAVGGPTPPASGSFPGS